MTTQATNDQRENTRWIDRYAHVLCPGDLVLDLGCGTGADTIELAALGCRVVALDFDPARVGQVPAEAATLRLSADLDGQLPFIDGAFDTVMASLSLHYLTSEQTSRAILDIHRILAPDGYLLCRVNAIGDTNFGYGQGEEVEPSVFRHPDGHLKRFFNEPMIRRFLSPCFTLLSTRPRTILQRGIEKQTIECLARRR